MKRRWIWRALAVLIVAMLAVGVSRAEACGNEVLASTDDHVMRLKAAERALEDDDLVEARTLASGVLHDLNGFDGPDDVRRTGRRARRILAVARARDPQTSPGVLAADAGALASWRTKHDSPSDEVVYAEVAARVPARKHEAFLILRDYAKRDLIGSAYAYRALAVLADADGEDDIEAHKLGNAGCWRTARDRAICSGGVAKPALLRGTPIGYALALFPIVAMLLVKRLVPRRSSRGFQLLEIGAIAAAAALTFARAGTPSFATLVLVAALLALPSVVERHVGELRARRATA